MNHCQLQVRQRVIHWKTACFDKGDIRKHIPSNYPDHDREIIVVMQVSKNVVKGIVTGEHYKGAEHDKEGGPNEQRIESFAVCTHAFKPSGYITSAENDQKATETEETGK